MTTEVIKRKKRHITTTVERSLRHYMGIAWYGRVSILYCRECSRVIGEIPNNHGEEGWFNPGRTCQCGSIPNEDINIGTLAGPETARNLLSLLGFA